MVIEVDKRDLPGTSMKYRLADKRDIEAVYDVIKSAIMEMEADHIYQWDEVYPTKEDMMTDIESNSLFIGMLENNISVIYSINGECDEQYKNGVWKYPNSKYRILHRLCVDPKHQKKGVASMTLKHIESELKKGGIEAIRLDVFCNNPYALSLYRNNGYEEVGIAKWRKGTFFLMEKHL